MRLHHNFIFPHNMTSKKDNYGTVFFACFFFYVLFNFSLSSVLFFMHYPESYTWTELFINYEGGFIRRGLIGEIIYLLSFFIDTKFAVLLIFLPIYFLFVNYSVKLFKRGLDFYSFLIIIISPGLLFFFTQDRDMLCRKDIFFETGFIMQFLILSSNTKFVKTLISIILIHIFCLLVHESTIFYSILPFSILLEKAYSEKRFLYCLSVLFVIYIASVWYIFSFSGNIFQKELIIASWSKYFTIHNELALKYLGKPLSFQINQVREYFSATILLYYLLALILTAGPVVFIIKRMNALSVIANYFKFPLCKIFIFSGFIVPWSISLLAVDYGRHIHTATLNIIAFVATIFILANKEQKYTFSININKYLMIAILVFAFGWKLWHYASDGNIVTLSFPIRILLLGWTKSLSV